MKLNAAMAKKKVTCDDGIYYLIQDPYTYQEAEVVIEKPAVLKNNK